MSPSLSLSSLSLLAVATVLWSRSESVKTVLTANLTGSSSLSGWIILTTLLLLLLRLLTNAFRTPLKFIWHVFLAPIGAKNQRERLEKFYEGQADIYDATRKGLLRGRKTMITLSAAHLRVLRASAASQKRLIWVDIGGGTGFNIESMDKQFPIALFDAVYLIDLCEPLLQVARKRFATRGWKNVHVLCQDASTFTLPEWSAGKDPRGTVGFVTLSYSLSMIPSFYTVLDRIDYVLSPDDGLLAVCDFYTSGRQLTLHEKAIGGVMKECGWLSRWFWQIWFDFDHVSLSPQRREYIEYKFGTIKSYNGRNRFIPPFSIPYYVWLGRPRSCDVSRLCHAFEIEGGNSVGAMIPHSSKAIGDSNIPASQTETSTVLLDKERTEASKTVVIDVSQPLTSFHYQIKKPWRLPYYEHPVHKEFRTFLYSFTWEDPMEDMKHLDLTSDDSMFVITSAGDNALHYAIAAKPKRIHCVDINPCQGHLFELKLAAIQALSFEEFFAMFGEGRQPQFRTLLDTKLSPYLSSISYQFWRINSDLFRSSFYQSGYSGWALRLASWLFWLAGITPDVERICAAETIAEQERLWNDKIRPVILNPVVVSLLKNPLFCWNALGVPINQRRMLLAEGSARDFIRDTLDPLASTALFKDGAYHYLLTLLGHYTHNSCPLYLKRDGFDTLRADDGEAMNAFRVHTDSIINVLRGLSACSLTRAIIMDHLDWFSPGSREVDEELAELFRTLAPRGILLWRSAAKRPWYAERFARVGFEVSVLATRNGNKVAIDGVNMYASLWRAVKP